MTSVIPRATACERKSGGAWPREPGPASYQYRFPAMALVRIVTFLIQAIVVAMASLLVAVFTHVASAVVAIAALVALVLAVGTSCSVGGLALLRKRRKTGD